jgi:hypothetical protein
VTSIGVHIQVAQGQVRDHRGVSFAGSYQFPALDDQPTTIEITVWDNNSDEERKVTLREGETFEIAGQTWRLDKIHEDPRRWCADLTRIA